MNLLAVSVVIDLPTSIILVTLDPIITLDPIFLLTPIFHPFLAKKIANFEMEMGVEMRDFGVFS